MALDLAAVRNLGIAAHIDAGKTTLTERILYYTGRTHRMGDVDAGTTTTDFDEQEQKRGITIYSAAVSCPWRDCTINLIDTPGHVDFTAEVERSLRVLDGMVAIFDAKEGVESQSETVWRQADKYGIPRISFINKMDRMGADFERAVLSLRERLGATPLVLQLPIGSGGDFTGLIDLIEQKAVYYRETGAAFDVTEIPDGLLDAVSAARSELVETIADHSEDLLAKYLNEEAIGPDELRAAIRAATLDRSVVPVFCGSALRYIGVQRLLDAVCDYLPGPLDVPAVTAADPTREEVSHDLPCDPSGPLAALVFKVVPAKPMDLHYLRIYSGTLKSSVRVLNAATRDKENVSRIYRMFAKRRDQLDQATAGDIVAVIGPKNALTGHTLCDARRPLLLESITFPETVISVSVEPKSSRDRDKLVEALAALERQDPTLSVKMDPETGQTLISGMGELHLEVMTQRLRSDMNVDVSVGKPHVSYRETVTTAAEVTARFERPIGGRVHFAGLRLRLEPRPHQEGRASFEVLDALPEGSLAPELAEAAKTGIVDAAGSGVLGGYPVIDWTATLVAVDCRAEDSSELAFEGAGRKAFYDAMSAADPVLLEPIMDVEVVTSDEYFGAIVTDLSARKAIVRDSAVRGTDRIISAEVPLAQMFGYVTKLRSLSQGRATSSMTPSRYAPVPPEVMKPLVG